MLSSPSAITMLATLLSLAVKVAMIPQIKLNHKRHSVNGMSRAYFFLGLLTYFTGGTAAYIHADWANTIGQWSGVPLSLVIAGQVLLYQMLPAMGKRSGDFGHFSGYKKCLACKPLSTDARLWQIPEGVFPHNCTEDECPGGLVHLRLRYVSGGFQKRALAIRWCDQCTFYAEQTLNARRRTRPGHEHASYWVRENGTWRQVSYLQFREVQSQTWKKVAVDAGSSWSTGGIVTVIALGDTTPDRFTTLEGYYIAIAVQYPIPEFDASAR